MKIGAAQVIVALALAVLCCETLAETVKDGKKCPVLDCKGKNCKTKLAVSGCLECDCEKECPVLHCPPPCHPEENVPQDRCPECVCNGGGVPHPADDGQDVPCFTPMLRRTLRRLAELENQLRHVRHLVDDNELRLLRLFPALESRGGKVPAPTPACRCLRIVARDVPRQTSPALRRAGALLGTSLHDSRFSGAQCPINIRMQMNPRGPSVFLFVSMM
ncbi:uncharacterized protein LOC120849603 [Ixodes scapularis]|uniref:uncharacterized protein LOC120849603 n=1 Tax=Ixodes scapularis TaxID=6945 RepID=UPI001C391189|nr:uncharacterized protein LOC120849603 [Ixodes scapularis]